MGEPAARARAVDILLVEDNMADMRLTVEAIRDGAIDCNLLGSRTGSRAAPRTPVGGDGRIIGTAFATGLGA
jgi:hypothetical protein